MPSERTRGQLDRFAKALATLREALALSETRTTRDSLLLRFLYCFEMAWQSLYWTLQDLGEAETARLAAPTLDTAFRAGLIGDAALWKSIREARNAVSHAYDEKVAIQIAALVRSRAVDAFEGLLAALQARS